MKAISQETYGEADVLEVKDLEPPTIGDDEVLIRVRAAGVDRGVWHLMTGQPYLVRIMGFGLTAPNQKVPGHDLAGVVEAVGANVDRFVPGDEVFGTGKGTFAEYTRASQDTLALKPPSITFEEAAAVPTSAVTALHALRETGNVAAGQRVLIVGASGGVGSFAVQLAKVFGATVTGVCSTSKVDLVRAAGADDVIDYTAGDFTATDRRWDLVLDIGGSRPVSRLRRVMTERGTLVIVGGENGEKWTGGVERQLGAMLLSPFIRQTLRTFFSEPGREDLELMRELLETGQLRPVLDRTFPLDEAPAAIRYIADGRARGKVVVAL